jgi:prephenate dehydrogenase
MKNESDFRILVVGLGLLGGSFCKALKEKTDARIFGMDIDKKTQALAENGGVIEKTTQEDIKNSDLTIVALHPGQTKEYILKYAELFKKGSIVIDICGVKKEIVESVENVLEKNGVSFLGTHPMAGREFSGYEYSLANLFEGTSFIITPTAKTSEKTVGIVKELACKIGFKTIVKTTPEKHDEIIAFTSQLAHVVSNAYIKSPTSKLEKGFSAGSFLDLTRVAKLNENMWSELFMFNKSPLIFELETIIEHLVEYKNAIENDDKEALTKLLKDGRIAKEQQLMG